MRRWFGSVVVAVLVVVVFASVSLGGGVGAQEQPPAGDEGEQEPLPQADDLGAAAITHADDVIIDDVGDISSDLYLRDPGTADDWRISGGTNGDFYLYDPDPSLRMYHGDGPTGDSFFIGRDDVSISASGGGSSGGDVTVTASGVDGDITLRADGDQTIVDSFGNVGSVAEVFRLRADVPPQQVFNNSSSGAEWLFAMTADDQFKISRNGTGTVEAKFFDNGNLQIAGTLIQTSDVNAKSNLVPADTSAVLDALLRLDIAAWEYKSQPGVVHLGPTAQDFAAAFGLGDTSTGIAAIDADGVALAAIQAVARQNDELRADVADQGRLIAELLERIEALEAAG